MPSIEFNQVSKEYTTHGTSIALKDISFSIAAGEFTALAGPSGSGKTTLLNLAAGLDHPSSGSVSLFGKNLSKLGREATLALRRKSVGFIFQAHNLLPVLTAIENVEYPLALRGLSFRQRRDQALHSLKDVGLLEFADRFPKELSGGQQQRVAVARAMVTRPQIIFADEPTASLDSASAESLLALFQKLNQQYQTTFLFSSHDPKVLNIARRVISIADGTISNDTKGTLFDSTLSC